MNDGVDIKKMSKSIPMRLKVARLARGYSNRSQFAKDCGAGITTYRAHERGDYELKASDVIRYSEQLDVSMRWLLMGLGHPLEHKHDPNPETLAQFLYYLHLEDNKIEIKQQIANEVLQILSKKPK